MPRPKIEPSTLGKKEKNEACSGKRCQKACKDLIPDVEIELEVENLPKGSRFKEYRDYFVQDIQIKKIVTRYRIKVYQLPDGTLKAAKLPENINGHFGNELKQYIICQNHVNNVSQVKIKQELNSRGIQISEGQINNIIINSSEILSKEYEDIANIGITTARELRVDDTGSRHKGQNGSSIVIQNDFFTYFNTSSSKSRIQFLKTLRVKGANYILNDVALNYIEEYKPTAIQMEKLLKLKNINFANKEAYDKALIEAEITPIIFGKKLLLHIEEAGILGSIIENGLSQNLVLLSDGASQYNLFSHASCWIHAERAVKKLVPIDEADTEEIKKVRNDIWCFYERLKDYKKNPNDASKIIIEKTFDEIFSQNATSIQLAVTLKKFRTKKSDLLRVLDYPFIDLHNNSSEQDIRPIVIKRNISGPTRSDKGRNARDIFITIVKTCKKNNISILEYLTDRINGKNKIPYLPDLIAQKAKAQLIAPT